MGGLQDSLRLGMAMALSLAMVRQSCMQSRVCKMQDQIAPELPRQHTARDSSGQWSKLCLVRNLRREYKSVRSLFAAEEYLHSIQCLYVRYPTKIDDSSMPDLSGRPSIALHRWPLPLLYLWRLDADSPKTHMLSHRPATIRPEFRSFSRIRAAFCRSIGAIARVVRPSLGTIQC